MCDPESGKVELVGLEPFFGPGWPSPPGKGTAATGGARSSMLARPVDAEVGSSASSGAGRGDVGGEQPATGLDGGRAHVFYFGRVGGRDIAAIPGVARLSATTLAVVRPGPGPCMEVSGGCAASEGRGPAPGTRFDVHGRSQEAAAITPARSVGITRDAGCGVCDWRYGSHRLEFEVGASQPTPDAEAFPLAPANPGQGRDAGADVSSLEPARTRAALEARARAAALAVEAQALAPEAEAFAAECVRRDCHRYIELLGTITANVRCQNESLARIYRTLHIQGRDPISTTNGVCRPLPFSSLSMTPARYRDLYCFALIPTYEAELRRCTDAGSPASGGGPVRRLWQYRCRWVVNHAGRRSEELESSMVKLAEIRCDCRCADGIGGSGTRSALTLPARLTESCTSRRGSGRGSTG